MAKISADMLAIDCPDPKALATFYASLLGTEVSGEDAFVLPSGMEVWFQPVEDYQAPTWPTQERGQQMHMDFATPDIGAAAEYAVSLGATKPDAQPSPDDWVVMLDPAGHPFCFVKHREEWDGDLASRDDAQPASSFRIVYVDCPDHLALAAFYTSLLDASPLGEANDEYVAIRPADGFVIGFQKVEGYEPPTWPSQERGQQMHFDFMVDDMDAAQARAIKLGATLVDDGQESFHVLLDPAGHPFCLCIPEE